MEKGSKRPDSPAIAQATVRAACAVAASEFPGLPLFAGGKSFGGRMTSRAQAESPLPSIRGLVFVGFPLHPAKQPAIERAEHLARVDCPMLFLQGTRDELADAALIESVVRGLGTIAQIAFFNDADHAFHVRKQSGSTDDLVRDAMLDTMVAWINRAIAA
jgi:uncharacterized protein